MLAVRKSLKSHRGWRARRWPTGAGKNLAVWRLLAFLIAQILLIIFLDHQIHPLVKSFGENQAKFTSTKAINEAVTQVLTDEQIRYEDLVTVARNEVGDIVSVEADISKINRLKAEITTVVLERLKEYAHLEMRIPLGSILGGEMFNDRGPRIPLRVTMSGNALTTMNSAFSSGDQPDLPPDHTAYRIADCDHHPRLYQLPQGGNRLCGGGNRAGGQGAGFLHRGRRQSSRAAWKNIRLRQ